MNVKLKNGFVASAAIGVAATVLAGAGGYLARASAEPAPVNAGMPAPQASGIMPGAPSSFADIVQKVAPAVVSIDVEGKADASEVAAQGGPFSFGAPKGGDDGDDNNDDQGQGFDFRKLIPQPRDGKDLPPVRATGSGFFISADGYIVTNNHVVEHADKITVRTKDERELKARLIGRDPATDLAVIKVEGAAFPYVDFEDTAKPRVGDWVIAVGNPYNLGGTATAGIVSALGRQNLGDTNYVDYMQIDAPINRGNSGGPTFDMFGRVVGVNTMIFSPSGGSVGIGFDIPADVAVGVTRQLIATGKVVRGYIGATVQDVSPEIAESLGLPKKQGALVADLTPGGPSATAGVKTGDLVLKVNGHEVASATDLTRQVGLAKAGDDIHLEVRRDGQVREISVRSGVRPSEAQLAKANFTGGAAQPDAPPAAERVLGMRLTPSADGGLTVDGVASSSDAAQKGVRHGDVILQANDHKLRSAADLTAAAAEAKHAGRKAVLLMVMRNGQRVFLPVSVDEAPKTGEG